MLTYPSTLRFKILESLDLEFLYNCERFSEYVLKILPGRIRLFRKIIKKEGMSLISPLTNECSSRVE